MMCDAQRTSGGGVFLFGKFHRVDEGVARLRDMLEELICAFEASLFLPEQVEEGFTIRPVIAALDDPATVFVVVVNDDHLLESQRRRERRYMAGREQTQCNRCTLRNHDIERQGDLLGDRTLARSLVENAHLLMPLGALRRPDPLQMLLEAPDEHVEQLRMQVLAGALLLADVPTSVLQHLQVRLGDEANVDAVAAAVMDLATPDLLRTIFLADQIVVGRPAVARVIEPATVAFGDGDKVVVKDNGHCDLPYMDMLLFQPTIYYIFSKKSIDKRLLLFGLEGFKKGDCLHQSRQKSY